MHSIAPTAFTTPEGDTGNRIPDLDLRKKTVTENDKKIQNSNTDEEKSDKDILSSFDELQNLSNSDGKKYIFTSFTSNK